jgi:hypothetical protein
MPPSYARRYLWVSACGNVTWISPPKPPSLPTQVMAGVTVTCGPREIESFFRFAGPGRDARCDHLLYSITEPAYAA